MNLGVGARRRGTRSQSRAGFHHKRHDWAAPPIVCTVNYNSTLDHELALNTERGVVRGPNIHRLFARKHVKNEFSASQSDSPFVSKPFFSGMFLCVNDKEKIAWTSNGSETGLQVAMHKLHLEPPDAANRVRLVRSQATLQRRAKISPVSSNLGCSGLRREH
ncbi:uncharacterized protein MEPE_02294 [Melanopsichium pennsylvanicum]|uniref:Uncharacterized protein n=1 Tax=Melanopsichium pennsylvanicum TaxID=63383 RepID=A0AAJ4XJP7_9BASI|nr:uncharacterized protein MEPE_02294 [Melanopsichium pennsylvanicum]